MVRGHFSRRQTRRFGQFSDRKLLDFSCLVRFAKPMRENGEIVRIAYRKAILSFAKECHASIESKAHRIRAVTEITPHSSRSAELETATREGIIDKAHLGHRLWTDNDRGLSCEQGWNAVGMDREREQQNYRQNQGPHISLLRREG